MPVNGLRQITIKLENKRKSITDSLTNHIWSVLLRHSFSSYSFFRVNATIAANFRFSEIKLEIQKSFFLRFIFRNIYFADIERPKDLHIFNFYAVLIRNLNSDFCLVHVFSHSFVYSADLETSIP